jgi:hypothetical protein
VTTKTRRFAWLTPLSANEHAPEPNYPSPILTVYFPKFILVLSAYNYVAVEAKFVGTFLAHEEFHLPLLEVSRAVGREGT